MKIEKLLKSNRIRVTPFRKKVLDFLVKANQSVSLKEIEDFLGEHDRVTLYRTIKLFIDKELIHEINLLGTEKKYALGEGNLLTAQNQQQHIHFHCSYCDKVFCVDMDETPTLQIPNFKINEIEIQVRGICETCRVQENS